MSSRRARRRTPSQVANRLANRRPRFGTAQALGPVAKALEAWFDRERRARGARYAAQDRVEVLLETSRAILARVSGTERYWTSIKLERGVAELACDCPCAIGGEACKHLWAVALVADEHGVLGAVAGDGVRRVRVTEAEAMFEDEPEADDSSEGFEASWRDDDRLAAPDGFIADDELADPEEYELADEHYEGGLPARVPSSWRELLAVSGAATDAVERGANAVPRSSRDLVYVLDPEDVLQTNRVFVHLWLRDGKGQRSPPVRMTTASLDGLAVDDADALLLSLAVTGPALGPQAVSLSLPQRGLHALMAQLCTTERFCYWPGEARRIVDAPALRWDGGTAWRLRLVATPRSGGLVVQGALVRSGPGGAGEEERPLSHARLVLSGGVVFWSDCIAPLDVGQAPGRPGATAPVWQWIAALRASKGVPIAAEDVESFLDGFLSRDSQIELRMPDGVRFERATATPKLELDVHAPEQGKPLVAAVSMTYGERTLRLPHHEDRVVDAASRRIYDHDVSRERAAFERLRALGFQGTDLGPFSTGRVTLAASKLPSAVRQLVADGWEVRAQGKRHRAAAEFRIRVSSGKNWFEIEGGAQFDDQRIGMPELLGALKKGERTVVLGDGSIGILPDAWLDRFGLLAASMDVDATESKAGAARVPRSQLLLVNALVDDAPGASVDAAFAKLRTRLTELGDLEPIDPPKGFVGTLRAYQRVGVAWIRQMRELGFGCCLADDMGLGKTIQVLAFLLLQRDEARRKRRPRMPSLVIAPRAVLYNWLDEARRFAPSLRVAVHAGPNRHALSIALGEADVVVSTYALVRAEAKQFAEAEFDTIVLDEAQAIKNHDTATAKVARALRANHRLALTGTPIENHLGELCSQLEFLNPGMFSGSAAVQRALANGAASAESLRVIQRASRPFLLRRTKKQVARDLPDRTERTVFVELEGAERRRYDELLAHYRDRIDQRVREVGLTHSTPMVLEALLRLRQAACHPGLLDARRSKQPSAKLARLLEDLGRVVEAGEKALVFSQFTNLLGIVKAHLDRRKLAYEYLDGATVKREERVARFQSDPSVPIFLISLKAGGVGMNLTAAEHVFLLDPWWNPAVEAQAIDRTHRIGQRRRVSAYKLIARRTVEEKVIELQREKRELAAAILGEDAGLGAKLTREDLEALMS